MVKRKKQQYRQPELKTILIDTEISLQLQSEPPIGPNESIGMMQNKVDLFKEIIA